MTTPSQPFRGVWVKSNLLEDTTLNGLEKLIMSVVSQWDEGEGCPLTRRQLTDLLGTNYQTLTSCLDRLLERGRLRSQEGGIRCHKSKSIPVSHLVRKPKVPDPVELPAREKELVVWFYQTQREQFPRMVKEPTPSQLKAGVTTLVQLQRIDGYTWEEINRTVRHGVVDSFWGRNLLSPVSLRQKCRNGATKFANIHQQVTEKAPTIRRLRTTTPPVDSWVSPIVKAFTELTRCTPTPQQVTTLETALGELWDDLPGETTKQYVTPPTQNVPGKRSLRWLLKSRSGIVPHVVEFIRTDMKHFSTASFGYLTGGGWDKIMAFLEKRIGHRLSDGTPLR